jgi:signal transduction histidine kinase
VEVSWALRSGTRVRVSVADTGPGISPEELPHVFLPFRRGRRTNSHPGTGLGLPLAQRLVEAMGGAIGAESTPGSGSVFWFELPAM